MSICKLSELTEGDLCRVQYKYDEQLMEMVAVWLGRGGGGYADDTFWSLRPLAGTQTLARQRLVQIEIVKPAAERLGQRGDEGAQLPRQVKGD